MNNPDFHAELDRLGYQGERLFRKAARVKRQAERKQKPEYQRAKRLWHEMTDIPEHGRAKAIADRADITVSYKTVCRWCRDWRDKDSTDNSISDAIQMRALSAKFLLTGLFVFCQNIIIRFVGDATRLLRRCPHTR